ncbi:hypothetical protein [Undibacterium terreum]|nr:hypothetical protein [Undibacterium terreum]
MKLSNLQVILALLVFGAGLIFAAYRFAQEIAYIPKGVSIWDICTSDPQKSAEAPKAADPASLPAKSP